MKLILLYKVKMNLIKVYIKMKKIGKHHQIGEQVLLILKYLETIYPKDNNKFKQTAGSNDSMSLSISGM